MPLPHTVEAVRHVARRVRQVQDALGRQLLLENVSSYLRFDGDELSEWQFLAAIVAESGCGVLLDVNNVYVNSQHHGFDPNTFTNGMPLGRVKQIHCARHSVGESARVLFIASPEATVSVFAARLSEPAPRPMGDWPG